MCVCSHVRCCHENVICLVVFSCCFSHGALIGFTDIGDVNTHITAFEHSLGDKCEDRLADSKLVLMVKRLFISLKLLYAQFPCTEFAGEQLHTLF